MITVLYIFITLYQNPLIESFCIFKSCVCFWDLKRGGFLNFFLFLLFFCLRQGLSLQLRLTWYSLYCLGWPQTCSHPHVSASQGLGLQTRATEVCIQNFPTQNRSKTRGNCRIDKAVHLGALLMRSFLVCGPFWGSAHRQVPRPARIPRRAADQKWGL